MEEYLPTDALQNVVLQPFYATNTIKKYNVLLVTKGGGIHGQTGAMSLAIARALVMIDESLRPVLREQKLLTRDSRMKERKKAGRPGARPGAAPRSPSPAPWRAPGSAGRPPPP